METKENKIMNAASSTGLNDTKVSINVDDHDRIERNAKSVKRRRLRARLPYLVNAIITILFATGVVLIEYGFIPSRKVGFFCQDPVISHKFTGETISTVTLGVVTLAGPLLIFGFVEAYRHRTQPKKIGAQVWWWYKEYLIGLSMTLCITEICKVAAGELRPHFFDTCAPDTAENCTKGTYITEYKCTSTHFSNYLVVDSSRSFPSGHSSLGMFTSLFCANYLQARLRPVTLGELFKPLVLTLTILWGPSAGISRIVDHRHHWWDVLSGLILGLSVAFYIINFPCKRVEMKTNNRSTTSMTTLYDTRKDTASAII